MRFKLFLTASTIVLLYGGLPAQSILMPNYGLKSHETLVISKIEATSASTKFFMTIENKIANGYFCADKNIYLIYPDGSRSKIESSENIPVCPETHKFTTPGEKLSFTLTFPPLKPGTEWIDLVEDCSDNCFSFYGVTLDDDINAKINEAFSLSESGQMQKALECYIKIEEAYDKKNPGIEGFLYLNIITLSRNTGNNAQADEWYRKMKSSGAPRVEKYIQYLNELGEK
jgi:hypothetical protein